LDIEGANAYGVRNRMVIAANCIDPASMPSAPDRGILLTRFPKLRGHRIFLYLGRLDPQQKGLDLLVRAWARVRDQDRGCLVLVGPDWRTGRSQLEGIAGDVGSDVVFTGPFRAMRNGACAEPRLTSSCIPSRLEAGVPFSVLEAMPPLGRSCLRPADPDGMIRLRGRVVVEPHVESIASGLRRWVPWDPTSFRAMGQRGAR
jgi:glycosyltransferase involved in cell wall biosynthesis